ncbi:aspartate aminotransferase, cytoplasmic-like [Symsagittifera roscoffensis]|uniref:aspartate aminotransferase, cytoplasmic-like n=1 Tax=Symsagittifera roscoffensis TaxID=84072 RepID=UPI00307BCB85
MFDGVEAAPPVKVFQLTADFKACTGPNKVNLGVGAYQTNEGKPYVLKVVKEAEQRISKDFTLTHEYLPIDGLAAFTDASTAVMFGKESPLVVNRKYIAVQCLGGTGALRLCSEFMFQCLKRSVAYVSKPTWPNHNAILKTAGITDVRSYRYWDPNTKSVDFQGMVEDLKGVPEYAVIFLHAVAHNPTGMDLSTEQWQEILDILIKRNATIVMDTAYQGFASGDLDKDAASVRMLADKGVEFFVCQSMSKNFGLYNERVGNMIAVIHNADKVEAVRSQLKRIVRANWSNPPSHGALVVATILNDETLAQQWRLELMEMAGRIKDMRQLLYEKLQVHQITWPHVINQTGMFSFTGLNPAQVKFLRDEYDVFLMEDGRVNMCAFTTSNAQYIADAIAAAVNKA